MHLFTSFQFFAILNFPTGVFLFKSVVFRRQEQDVGRVRFTVVANIQDRKIV